MKKEKVLLIIAFISFGLMAAVAFTPRKNKLDPAAGLDVDTLEKMTDEELLSMSNNELVNKMKHNIDQGDRMNIQLKRVKDLYDAKTAELNTQPKTEDIEPEEKKPISKKMEVVVEEIETLIEKIEEKPEEVKEAAPTIIEKIIQAAPEPKIETKAIEVKTPKPKKEAKKPETTPSPNNKTLTAANGNPAMLPEYQTKGLCHYCGNTLSKTQKKFCCQSCNALNQKQFYIKVAELKKA